ncbi:MAG: hypothetical protein AAGA92_10010 [Planctomycetota bacterium]
MKLLLKTACSTVAIATFAGMLTLGSSAQAQERAADSPTGERSESWYYGSTQPAQTYTVAQQKAMARAAARTARLESSRWYGFHHARPTATAMAFTSMYSPAWQMPGARPFAWYHGNRGPVVIVR